MAAVVAMTDLLCPRFVDIEGAVLMETSADPEGFQAWKEYFDRDLRAVEAMLNDEHVCDIFTSDDETNEAASGVRRRTRCQHLASGREAQFPDRALVCEVTDEYGPTVTITTAVP